MANPAYLLCDTDALIQLYLTGHSDLLDFLRRQSRIQAAVVPEVEIEIRCNGEFGARFEPAFLRSKEKGQIVAMDHSSICAFLTTRITLDPETIAYRILADGKVNSGFVQRGEAYSHAVAAALNLPLMSNDMKAVGTLERQPRPVAVPTIRFMDLVVFAYRQGALKDSDCKKIVHQLRGQNEFVPREFVPGTGGFAHCAQRYKCRLDVADPSSSVPEPRLAHHTLYISPVC